MGNRVRVLIADDHALVREAIRSAAELDGGFEVVAEAESASEALEMVRAFRPDLLLADLRLADGNAFTLIRRVRDESPGTQVLVLTVYDEETFVAEAVRSGALGYMLKTASLKEVLEAMRATAEGKAYLHPVAAEKLLREFSAMRGWAERSRWLTEREREVLRLLGEGKANKEIAASLGVTEQTVKTHLSKIFRKLGAGGRAAAVAEGLRRGLIS